MPTPPFWLATVSTRVCSGRGNGASRRAPDAVRRPRPRPRSGCRPCERSTSRTARRTGAGPADAAGSCRHGSRWGTERRVPLAALTAMAAPGGRHEHITACARSDLCSRPRPRLRRREVVSATVPSTRGRPGRARSAPVGLLPTRGRCRPVGPWFHVKPAAAAELAGDGAVTIRRRRSGRGRPRRRGGRDRGRGPRPRSRALARERPQASVLEGVVTPTACLVGARTRLLRSRRRSSSASPSTGRGIGRRARVRTGRVDESRSRFTRPGRCDRRPVHAVRPPLGGAPRPPADGRRGPFVDHASRPVPRHFLAPAPVVALGPGRSNPGAVARAGSALGVRAWSRRLTWSRALTGPWSVPGRRPDRPARCRRPPLEPPRCPAEDGAQHRGGRRRAPARR